MVCGLVADLNRRRLTLFNDRYGMSRVYFYEGTDDFLFASEAKALLRVRSTLRTINPEALAQHLRFNCVIANRTLFKGISLLPPGSSWVFQNGRLLSKQRYFDFADWEKQPALQPDAFHQQFVETISRVFPAYMRGPLRIALSLTAGLDSRVILASADRMKRPLPCYTFGGIWGETFDIRTARKLATICGQSHEVIRINQEFLNQFPQFASRSIYISDGTHDALGAHDVYFNQIARDLAPIRLTGKFGSEVVRTRKLIPSVDFPRDLMQPWFRAFLDEVPSLDQMSQKTHPLSRVVTEEIPWYESGRLTVEQSNVILRTPYMDNELVKLMYQAPPGFRASRDLQVRYIREKRPELGTLRTDLGRIETDGPLISKLVDIPFWALFKIEYLYLYATPHWLTWVDRRLEKLRPERILTGRQKFEAYRIWLKTDFADFLHQTLLNPRAHCTNFFDKRSLARVVASHTAGTHNYLNEINKILTLELIYSSLLTC